MNIDNRNITVSATLTKKGREILARTGQLNITSFALSDDDINYDLYQPNHPQGSAFFDAAIMATPILEPLSDETQNLKYKLVTLNSGVTSIPTITLGQTEIKVSKNYKGEIIISPSTTPAYNIAFGYTAILSNRSIGTIIGDKSETLSTVTIPNFFGDSGAAGTQTSIGNKFRFVPNSAITKTTTATLTIIGNESGGSVSIPVTVTIES